MSIAAAILGFLTVVASIALTILRKPRSEEEKQKMRRKDQDRVLLAIEEGDTDVVEDDLRDLESRLSDKLRSQKGRINGRSDN